MITKKEMVALRKEKAEMDTRYKLTRSKALAQLYKMMCEDHKEYAASELADITGLSKNEVRRYFHNNWRKFEKRNTNIVKKYAELNRDGVPMMDKIHSRTYYGKVYKVKEK